MQTSLNPAPRRTRLRTAAAAGVLTLGAGLALAVPVAASAAGTAPAPCPVVQQGVLLDRGDRGVPVQAVQCVLGVTTDGIFGPQTEAALRDFQRRQGLTVDGIAGPQSLRALATAATIDSPRAETRAAVAAGPVLRKGDRGPAVQVVQTALGITADGIFGERTETAVRSVQIKQGLEVDGIVGPDTRGALAAGAAAH